MTLEDALWLALSVFGIFFIVIIITRLFGLRTFAKMSSFDFASTIDRKSTRLNSSHVRISYAVFCLKKKKMITLAILTAEIVFKRYALDGADEPLVVLASPARLLAQYGWRGGGHDGGMDL